MNRLTMLVTSFALLAGLMVLWADRAFGEESVAWTTRTQDQRQSVATIRATTEQGAVAEVAFENETVNDNRNNGRTEITLGHLTVGVTFTWDDGPHGADSITIDAPPGFIAVPDVLVVPEGDSAVALIFPLVS